MSALTSPALSSDTSSITEHEHRERKREPDDDMELQLDQLLPAWLQQERRVEAARQSRLTTGGKQLAWMKRRRDEAERVAAAREEADQLWDTFPLEVEVILPESNWVALARARFFDEKAAPAARKAEAVKAAAQRVAPRKAAATGPVQKPIAKKAAAKKAAAKKAAAAAETAEVAAERAEATAERAEAAAELSEDAAYNPEPKPCLPRKEGRAAYVRAAYNSFAMPPDMQAMMGVGLGSCLHVPNLGSNLRVRRLCAPPPATQLEAAAELSRDAVYGSDPKPRTERWVWVELACQAGLPRNGDER